MRKIKNPEAYIAKLKKQHAKQVKCLENQLNDLHENWEALFKKVGKLQTELAWSKMAYETVSKISDRYKAEADRNLDKFLKRLDETTAGEGWKDKIQKDQKPGLEGMTKEQLEQIAFDPKTPEATVNAAMELLKKLNP